MIPTQRTIDFNSTVSEIVRGNYRTADVMKKFGINYCCGGKASLAEACSNSKVDQKVMKDELERALITVSLPPNIKFEQWPVEFMIDYIQNVHHAYTRQVLPKLAATLVSFVEGHRKKYPYLDSVLMAFEDLHLELALHLEKEETTVFPYLKIISNAYKNKEVYGGLFVRTMGMPIDVMMLAEHKRIGSLRDALRKQANHFDFPESACTNHQVIYQQLKELDQDLEQHLNFENNLLFPRIFKMEKELLKF